MTLKPEPIFLGESEEVYYYEEDYGLHIQIENWGAVILSLKNIEDYLKRLAQSQPEAEGEGE